MDSWPLVHLELYLSGKNLPVFFSCFVKVIPIVYTVLDDTLCSFGQGTTSVLPFLLEEAVSEKRSFAVCVKFIHIADIASMCDMVGMCTGMSSAHCSPRLPPLFLEFVLLFLWCLI